MLQGITLQCEPVTLHVLCHMNRTMMFISAAKIRLVVPMRYSLLQFRHYDFYKSNQLNDRLPCQSLAYKHT